MQSRISVSPLQERHVLHVEETQSDSEQLKWHFGVPAKEKHCLTNALLFNEKDCNVCRFGQRNIVSTQTTTKKKFKTYKIDLKSNHILSKKAGHLAKCLHRLRQSYLYAGAKAGKSVWSHSCALNAGVIPQVHWRHCIGHFDRFPTFLIIIR